MATIKSFTSLEQSRKLAEILSTESADMCYYYKDDKPQLTPYSEHNNRYYAPCWSLAALLDYLREVDLFPEIDADKSTVTINIKLLSLASVYNIKVKAESFIDACYDMILKLHEQKLL